MTPEALSAAVLAATKAVFAERGLSTDLLPASVTVERPRNAGHGDYATNIAMRLAKAAGVAPRDLAAWIGAALDGVEGVARAEVAGPGFLNLTIEAAAQGELASTIVTAGTAYGRTEALRGRRINVEFISANPTGPLHLGHTRWAAVGDALARVLDAAGAEVTREFYVNDRGVQLDRFGASILAAAKGDPIPPDGYHGDYVVELADAIAAEAPELLALRPDDQLAAFREEGYRRQVAAQQRTLADFGVHFDVWSSELSLYASGAVERGLRRLQEQGHVYQADGATWLRTTDFGDDKDRVLVKADGELTYFASDIAYYVDKRARGFDVCLYLLGADHHGYVGRLRAVAAGFGDDPDETVEVIIGQLVTLHGGRMSKRAGNLVTLDEAIALLGSDALRYALVRWSMDSPVDIDVDVWAARTNDNPVFYVQYAHARLASLGRNARELGVSLPPPAEIDYGLLSHEREGDLLRALGEFPRVAAAAAELRAPHRVARYLEELAGTYHRFYDVCRVLPSEHEDSPGPDLVHARLALCEATRIVLENGLGLIGVSAPDRM